MAEQLAVEVDVKNVTEYTAAAAGQALVFYLDDQETWLMPRLTNGSSRRQRCQSVSYLV